MMQRKEKIRHNSCFTENAVSWITGMSYKLNTTQVKPLILIGEKQKRGIELMKYLRLFFF